MTKEQIEAAAEAIGERLFVNGSGQRAQRLVLTVDGPVHRDLGGWSRPAVVDQIKAILASPPSPSGEPS